MCDRTNEFLSIVQSLSQKIVTKEKRIPDLPKSRSAFHEAASDIAKDIQRTSKSLSMLTKLIRRQGLFDDPSEEINTLVVRIKEDLSEINTKCDTAQQYIDSQKSAYRYIVHIIIEELFMYCNIVQHSSEAVFESLSESRGAAKVGVDECH